jgi:hypothetical protein
VTQRRKIGLLQQRLLCAAGLLGSTLSLGFATADPPRVGPSRVTLQGAVGSTPESGGVVLTIDGAVQDILEGALLPDAVRRMTGNATKLTFPGCVAQCSTAVSGVSLRASDSAKPLSLAALSWTTNDCGATTLALTPAGSGPGVTATLSVSRQGCEATLALTLADDDAPKLTYNPPPESPPTLAAGDTIVWRTRSPVSLDLVLRAERALLLSQSAMLGLRGVRGPLGSDFPALAGPQRLDVCKAAAGDTVNVMPDAWSLGAVVLEGQRLSFDATSLRKGLTKCTDRACKQQPTEACNTEWAVHFQHAGWTSASVIALVLSLLGFKLAGRDKPDPLTTSGPPPAPNVSPAQPAKDG